MIIKYKFFPKKKNKKKEKDLSGVPLLIYANK
jgi:hypothetical protein